MMNIGPREALLGGLGALSIAAVVYGAAAGDTWVLVAGTTPQG